MTDPDKAEPPLHDGLESIRLDAGASVLEIANAAALLMARFMNRYWDECQKQRRPVSHQVKFRVEPGKLVCEGKLW